MTAAKNGIGLVKSGELLTARKELDRLLLLMNTARERIISVLTAEEMGARQGGIAAIIMNANLNLLAGPVIMGPLPNDKLVEKCGFAFEKMMRVRQTWLRSSRLSRNEELGRFIGAIYAGRYIFSCSGLIEDADEAIDYLTAIWGTSNPNFSERWPIDLWMKENPVLARVPREELVLRP